MRYVFAHDRMKWMNLLWIIFFLRMHFITKTKGIELCHFPWAFARMFITRGDILMSDRCLPSCPSLQLCWFFFLLSLSSYLSYTKYHKLVWYICRKQNFIRMQYYFLQSSLDTLPLRLWLKAKSILVSLLDISCKKKV